MGSLRTLKRKTTKIRGASTVAGDPFESMIVGVPGNEVRGKMRCIIGHGYPPGDDLRDYTCLVYERSNGVFIDASYHGDGIGRIEDNLSIEGVKRSIQRRSSKHAERALSDLAQKDQRFA